MFYAGVRVLAIIMLLAVVGRLNERNLAKPSAALGEKEFELSGKLMPVVTNSGEVCREGPQ